VPASDGATTYYLWDGQPARKRGKYALVEVYVGGGDWKEYDEPEFSTSARRVDPEAVHDAMDQVDAAIKASR
jgi:hypothetical protein